MTRTLHEAVAELCLAFPEVEQFVSHGAANFRPRGGKVFAIFAINHHGDGRVALWLCAPAGAQAHWCEAAPEHYFVPPYVGPRGWLGVQLDQGLAWTAIIERVREAYLHVARSAQADAVAAVIDVAAPIAELNAEQRDPLQSTHAIRVITQLRALCMGLPEVVEDVQFGTPVWRAGKKTFAGIHAYNGPLLLSFWVGVERQSLMTLDPRFQIPAYVGHNGWLTLDVSSAIDWSEIGGLILDSYLHFAIKRMRVALQTNAAAMG